jgi:hypothetical protein
MMDQTEPPLRALGFTASLRAGVAVLVSVLIGAMVLFVASLVAMMTAFAGLMLAGAALLLRFVNVRQPAPIPVRIKDAPVTLQARRTPRGWTVE